MRLDKERAGENVEKKREREREREKQRSGKKERVRTEARIIL